MMMNQNFALQVYYWFYLQDDRYNRIVFDKRDTSYTRFNDFQTCGTDYLGLIQCRIKINNQIINMCAFTSTSNLKINCVPSIQLSMYVYKYMTDDDVERSERKIRRWRRNHASEFEYWIFDLTPDFGPAVVSRFIPMKELNDKSIYESVKYIDDVFNEVVETYTDLVIGG